MSGLIPSGVMDMLDCPRCGFQHEPGAAAKPACPECGSRMILSKAPVFEKEVPSMFKVYDPVRHVKTGKIFTVVGTPDKCRIEAGWVPAYAYLEENGMFVVRPQAEMEDGRFVLDEQKEAAT